MHLTLPVAGAAILLPVLGLLRLLQRRFGWEWVVLVVRRDDDVRTLKLPENLPVSVRPNIDGLVGMVIGHDDDGEALLADLRALGLMDVSKRDVGSREELQTVSAGSRVSLSH